MLFPAYLQECYQILIVNTRGKKIPWLLGEGAVLLTCPGALSWDKVFSQRRPFHRISTPGSAQNPAEVNQGDDPI